jgi:hypothetical protein
MCGGNPRKGGTRRLGLNGSRTGGARGLGWPIKTIDIIAIFPQFCLYGLIYRGAVILENPLFIFEFCNDWPIHSKCDPIRSVTSI